MPTGLRGLAAATACVLLAACAGPPPPTIRPKGVVPVTGASLSQPLPPVRPAPVTEPAAGPAPAPPPAVAAVPVPAPADPVAAPLRHGKGPKPEQIVDHPGRAVRALLGAPDLQRREPPAEVWQYTAESCVLDITFYPAKDGGAARAAYLESRTIAGARLEPAVCLGSLGRVTED